MKVSLAPGGRGGSVSWGNAFRLLHLQPELFSGEG
jgi:hypothetical protein